MSFGDDPVKMGLVLVVWWSRVSFRVGIITIHSSHSPSVNKHQTHRKDWLEPKRHSQSDPIPNLYLHPQQGNGSSSTMSTSSNAQITTIKVHDCADNEVEISYENPIDIGHGSFGTVSKCQLISPQFQTIAIKKVLQDKRFKNRELQIMKTLNNEHITKLFYYNYENDSASQTNSNNNNFIFESNDGIFTNNFI
ncbi:unnamed protein product [Wickerhamomyces anomalus]